MSRKTYTSTKAAQLVGVSRRQFVRLADKSGVFPAKQDYNLRSYFASDVQTLRRKRNKEMKSVVNNNLSLISDSCYNEMFD